jgi:hypothetical protein
MQRILDSNTALKIAHMNRDTVAGLFRVAVALGLLGFLLLGSLVFFRLYSGSWVPSISHSYHTATGDILVGTLCAIGVFLISYKDFNPEEYVSGNLGGIWTPYWDRWWSRAAGVGAIGVALLPVDPVKITGCEKIIPDALDMPCSTGGMTWHGGLMFRLESGELDNLVHFGFAGLFFVSIFVLCVFFFPSDTINARYLGGNLKKGWELELSMPSKRTIVFWSIGSVIALCIFGLACMQAFSGTQCGLVDFLEANNGFFWLEFAAVFAFSIAWLVKAQDFKLPKDSTKGGAA